MKTSPRSIWVVIAVIVFFLAILPVAWAMPEQSVHNQTIPTRTLAPPVVEPLPPGGLPMVPAPQAGSGISSALTTAGEVPVVAKSPEEGGASGAGPSAMPLPTLSALALFPGAAPLPAETWRDDQAGASGAAASGAARLPDDAARAGQGQAQQTLLQWLFPKRATPQAVTLAMFLGTGLLVGGIELLLFAQKHHAKPSA